MSNKEAARQAVNGLPQNLALRGLLAESVRRLDVYRNATQVFIDPSPLLLQARVNALVDGKDLIMPSAGLKQGFYLLKAFSLPFKKLLYAVTLKGALALGRRLGQDDLLKLKVGLLLAGAEALDNQGGRIGSGAGFFDLSAAILAASGALAASCVSYGVVDDVLRVVGQLEQEPWDVVLQGIVTPGGVQVTGASCGVPEIFWEQLPARKIRKIDPLWKLCPAQRRTALLADDNKKQNSTDKNKDKDPVTKK